MYLTYIEDPILRLDISLGSAHSVVDLYLNM